MAKKSGRKTKGSDKAKSKDSITDSLKTKPDSRPKSTAPKKKEKKSETNCQFCNKAMKDERTKKLHERNCKAKQSPESEPKKKNLESAILELKDHFQDEVFSMSKAMQEREEQHQREMDEVRTVLRMEIDHHRKELERISKVEKDVAAEKSVAAELPIAPEEQPQVQPEKQLPQRSIRAQESRPRAIDMIPLPVPTIPKKKFPPLPDDESIPEIDDEEFSPRPERRMSGINREEIESMIKDAVALIPEPSSSNLGDGLQKKIDLISGRLDLLDTKLERNISESGKSLEKLNKDSEFKKIEKDLEKVSEKVQDIMEDSGFGESLSVAKIPPTILEIVYQAILDDIHIEIMRTKGAQDAERVARSALEEVRLKTSGSELFKFDGRKIVTDSLAKSIEANLISARQIQTTYDVLLDKLLETVPHHKAKNFKGMIKVKSQEFAVDRATKLTKEFNKFEKILESTNQMVAAMAANFNTRNMEMHETLNEMQNTTLATKADREEIENLKSKVLENIERVRGLADDIALLKAEIEMKEKIKISDDMLEEDSGLLLAPGELPAPQSEAEAEIPAQPEAIEDNSENMDLVLSAVGKGCDSKSSITKDTGLETAVVIECLEKLTGLNKIIVKKVGKRVKYTTFERELGDKLKEDAEKQASTASSKEEPPLKKGRKIKEPIPVKEDTPEIPAEPAPEIVSEAESPAGGPAIENEVPEPAEKPAEDIPPPSEHETPKPTKSKKKGKKQPEVLKTKEITIPKPTEKAKKAKKPVKKAKSEKPEPESQPPAEEAAPAKEQEKDSDELPSKPVQVETAPKHKKEAKPSKSLPAEAPVIEQTEPEKEPEPVAGEHAMIDEFPAIKKSLVNLSDDERNVLDALSEEGMTVSGIQSKVGKEIKRFALLRALRVLIDSGYVGILTKGRLELYQKINVEKMDKMKQDNKQKEVK